MIILPSACVSVYQCVYVSVQKIEKERNPFVFHKFKYPSLLHIKHFIYAYSKFLRSSLRAMK